MLPPWLDRQAYPFAPHTLVLDDGRMHYVDEGAGAPIVFCHGNPTWSFMYRHLIRGLAPDHRCIAPDYLGFGLSDKPPGAALQPEAHARGVAVLLDTLALDDVTLVVHDWGGPIGLSYALAHPERVRRLVILNTWMWPKADEPLFVLFSRLMGSAPGRLLVERFNVFVRVIVPLLGGLRSRIEPAALHHYAAPADHPAARRGHWTLARALTGASGWLAHLWAQRERLAGKPTLLVWGLRDPAFRASDLERWHALLPHARVHRLEQVGHFVPEETGPALLDPVRRFLENSAMRNEP